MTNAVVLACVEPTEFEDTEDYSTYETIKAEADSEGELLIEFSEESELGRALLEYKKFVSSEGRSNQNDIHDFERKWSDGESIILQHILLKFFIAEIKFIKEKGYDSFLAEILNSNEHYCWIDVDNYYFLTLYYKLRAAKIYPEIVELEETISLLREMLLQTGDKEYLQDYFELLRLGGFELVKKEMGIWEGRGSSSVFCSGVAHCIERIRIEFENSALDSRVSVEEKLRNIECEGLFVNSSGNSIKIDLC